MTVAADGPAADCLVLPDHGLRWAVDAATCPNNASILLLDRDTGHLVRAPLEPSRDARWQFGVLGADALSEGRWDAYLETATGSRRRLRPNRLDARTLAAGRGAVGAPGGQPPVVRSHLPYRTANGFVAVRSWVREEHAEVRRVELNGDRIAIEFGWYSHGAAIPGRAVLRRRGPRDGSLVVEPVATTAGSFLIHVPLDELTARRLGRYEDWDIFLLSTSTGREVRLARVVDDVVEKKATYAFPEIRCEDAPGLDLFEENPAPLLRVRPYYTRDSELSIVVVDRY